MRERRTYSKRKHKRYTWPRRFSPTKNLFKPAKFENWQCGEDFVVVGFLRDVLLALQCFWPDICHCFKAEFVSPTLTRVTRVA